MSDPYLSSSSTAPTKLTDLGPAFGGGWGLGPTTPQVEQNAPDYLFAENYDTAYRRSWGERLTFHIGAAYLVGEELPWLKPLCPAPDSKRGCSPVRGRLVNGRIVRPCGGAPRLAG